MELGGMHGTRENGRVCLNDEGISGACACVLSYESMWLRWKEVGVHVS